MIQYGILSDLPKIYLSQLDVPPTQRLVSLLSLLLLLLVKKISQADLRAGLWTEQT